MARGTLLLLEPQESYLNEGLLGFTPPSLCQLSFLPLLLQQLTPYLPAGLANEIRDSRWRRCLGDRAELGLGEVLLRQATEHPPSARLNPS